MPNLENFDLHGNVDRVETFIKKTSSENDYQAPLMSCLSFDSNGLLSQEQRYARYGLFDSELSEIITYQYNVGGEIIQIVREKKSIAGSITITRNKNDHKYNNSGLLIKSEHYYINEEDEEEELYRSEFTYNQDGKLTEKLIVSNGFCESESKKYIYDNNEFWVNEETRSATICRNISRSFCENGKLKEERYFENGIQTFRTKYEYDEKGRIICKNTFCTGYIFPNKEVFEYSADGLLRYIINSDINKLKDDFTELIYDNKGNWIKKTTSSENPKTTNQQSNFHLKDAFGGTEELADPFWTPPIETIIYRQISYRQ